MALPGSRRRTYLTENVAESDLPIENELTGQGPDFTEWVETRRRLHRIGDAELIPTSRFRRGKGATPEGDLAG